MKLIVFWKDKIENPLARLRKYREDSIKQNQKWKGKHYNWYHRNKNHHKRLLWAIIWQQIG